MLDIDPKYINNHFIFLKRYRENNYHRWFKQTNEQRASKMAQREEVLTAKPASWSLIL